MPVPYYLKPKATKLAEGPDESLEPSEEPTDSEVRGVPPLLWPAVDRSPGPVGVPDKPAGPPPVDPAVRGLPPFEWPKGAVEPAYNKSVREVLPPEFALDPDIALWPAVVVSIWPFAGAPSEGIWPVGWMGIDETGVPYVCVVAGEPGTWEKVGTATNDDSGWLMTTPLNSWGGDLFYRRLNGVVYLNSTTANGSGAMDVNAWTLPVGFRPSKLVQTSGWGTQGGVGVAIGIGVQATDGNVNLTTFGGSQAPPNGDCWVSLSYPLG